MTKTAVPWGGGSLVSSSLPIDSSSGVVGLLLFSWALGCSEWNKVTNEQHYNKNNENTYFKLKIKCTKP